MATAKGSDNTDWEDVIDSPNHTYQHMEHITQQEFDDMESSSGFDEHTLYSLSDPNTTSEYSIVPPIGDDIVTTVYKNSRIVAKFSQGCRTCVLYKTQSHSIIEPKASTTDYFDRRIPTQSGANWNGHRWGRSPSLGYWANFNGTNANYWIDADGAHIHPISGGILAPRFCRLYDYVTDFDATAQVSVTDTVSTSTAQFGICAFRTTRDHYGFRVYFNASGSVSVNIVKRTAGVYENLGTAVTLISASVGYTPGQIINLRARWTREQGLLQLFAWVEGKPVPTSPQVVVTPEEEVYPSKLGVYAAKSTTEPHDLDFIFHNFTVNSAEWLYPMEVITNAYVYLLDDPFDGSVDLSWLDAKLNSDDESEEVLTLCSQYLTDVPRVNDAEGNRLYGDADYGPLYAPGRTWEVSHDDDGTRQEGSDWNDYMQVTAVYNLSAGTVTDAPEPYQDGCLDCSGNLRMVFGKRLGVPMCLSDPADFDGVNLPRVSHDIATSGPGVLIIPNTYNRPNSLEISKLLPGDILGFDADDDGGQANRIDHVGIYIGTDVNGDHRFLSSRKTPNGPTMSDLGGKSLIDYGTNTYSKALRMARRF